MVWDMFQNKVPQQAQNLQGSFGTAAQNQLTNLAQNPKFFGTDKLGQISQGFNMSMQNMQQNTQPQLANTMFNFMSRPLQDTYNKALNNIRNKYINQGFKQGSTYEALERGIVGENLNKSLLDAAEMSQIQSHQLANQNLTTYANLANQMANLGMAPERQAADLANLFGTQYGNYWGKSNEINVNNQAAYQNLLMGLAGLFTNKRSNTSSTTNTTGNTSGSSTATGTANVFQGITGQPQIDTGLVNLFTSLW